MSLAQKINRVVAPFEVISPYQPYGDQPKAIAELAARIEDAVERDVAERGDAKVRTAEVGDRIAAALK